MKIIGTILISLAAGVAILIGVGFGFTIYLSYKGARVPVYQTEISDFEFQRFTMNDKEIAEHLYTELHKLTEAHGVKNSNVLFFIKISTGQFTGSLWSAISKPPQIYQLLLNIS